jgi:hypothetical protein
MIKKKLLAFLIVLLIGGAVGIINLIKPSKPKNTVDPYLALFKSKCEVFQESPYRDPELNFSIKFTNDRILCLLKDRISGAHDIYIWQKNIFESKSINTSFQNAILGKVSIDSQDVKDLNVIETFSTKIDGESVTGEIVLPKNCTAAECPRAKKVTLQRFGKEFDIEEYNESINLFDNIHFNLQ